MKRFHVHLAVEDLARSIDFYTRLFGQAPATERPDYAKWMLDEPPVNFALSARGHVAGLNHFGIQVDSNEELAIAREASERAAGDGVLDQGEASCCYARSEKHWKVDPQGIAWEHFLTLADAPVFGDDTATQAGACCIPIRRDSDEGASAEAPCCVPTQEHEAGESCCS
jgi:catechol 2,3-dioxygenase-like lactoylglutathione lyase family enzyme